MAVARVGYTMIGNSPIVISEVANTVPSAAIATSAAATIPQPPARAWPCGATTTGVRMLGIISISSAQPSPPRWKS